MLAEEQILSRDSNNGKFGWVILPIRRHEEQNISEESDSSEEEDKGLKGFFKNYQKQKTQDIDYHRSTAAINRI